MIAMNPVALSLLCIFLRLLYACLYCNILLYLLKIVEINKFTFEFRVYFVFFT